MQLLDGKVLAAQLLESIKPQLVGKKLVIVLVGDNPASLSYVAMKQKKATEYGVETEVIRLSGEATPEAVTQVILTANKDSAVEGILVQLPLPEHLKMQTQTILNTLETSKDVDCLTVSNRGDIMTHTQGILPATVAGILRLINQTGLALKGKHAVIIGASALVGTPLALSLEQLGCTVTLCNEHTYNLANITKLGDIVVSAAGSPGLITKDHIKPGAVVIDVGTNYVDGKLCGDVVFSEVADITSWISPVPGGVGPMTIASLLNNLAQLSNR